MNQSGPNNVVRITIPYDKNSERAVRRHKSLRVAIANVRIDLSNYDRNLKGTPFLDSSRMRALNELLNEVIKFGLKDEKDKVDLLIFPELFLPHTWVRHICSWVGKHDVGVICGLEHRLVDNVARNEILTALPSRDDDGRTSCRPLTRLKRHYSPGERYDIEQRFKQTPSAAASEPYQLVHWCGASFTVYNCYELSDIKDRALFRSKVDFIVCIEYNSDTNYFAHIIEAASRDLHCYVVQVNSSDFGDSCVIRPSKTEMTSMVRVKGGDNSTFLTCRLDLQRLREFQGYDYGWQKGNAEKYGFKPTPPGLEQHEVELRKKLR